jgi:hypothetical protein
MHRLFPRPVNCKTRSTVKDRGRTVITVVCILTPHHHQAGTAVLTCREVGCEQCSQVKYTSNASASAKHHRGWAPDTPATALATIVYPCPAPQQQTPASCAELHAAASTGCKAGISKAWGPPGRHGGQMISPQQHPTTTLPHCRCAVYKYD